MRRTRPLPDTNPELIVIETPGLCYEYRVENCHLAQDGSRRVEQGTSRLSWKDGLCTQILWESILVIPPHGIQFETHRGFPPYPLFASRSFIPLIILQNFVINEGLRRWDVRFYLAAIKKASSGAMSMEVAYENILPRFPVLIEVYHGIHGNLQTMNEDTQNL
ncbi:hypothetical protein HETIRDRAFT_122293 [Heterobasidion irregulare TC 32-1]|uniref:Phosphatidylinositol N-acetylglucosaminyltransferase subunit H conserved domain-containing protein n=1 Tax=Heterobasidion irregulare (strain TC 32-1) TaxID=747525 RepID=W4KKW0_HETIT|nr:uncharacterized protein HETIRDRAFT_122293 [Heterobasidion irregulare TC 32-1]ETW85990.1 hypothetical protein HETIRDRAFT_122293 [Heterobasidion irregulare TC 32-1]